MQQLLYSGIFKVFFIKNVPSQVAAFVMVGKIVCQLRAAVGSSDLTPYFCQLLQ